MYYVIVILLMLVLPISSIEIELYVFQSQTDALFLIGKWFVFWSVGIRLFLAGLRQVFQPEFTAREIFKLQHDESLHIVQELGFANICIGLLGILTIFNQNWLVPAAMTGGLFYGLAGVKHVRAHSRNRLENVAMISDLFMFLVLVAYLGGLFFGLPK